jgi:SAM-dependent methyltransferase
MTECRNCGVSISDVFCDLGISPASNDYIKDLSKGQTVWPLKVYICHNCFLVQLPETVDHKKIFSDYLYLSSMSPSWVKDREELAIRMRNEFNLDRNTLVVDVASNDGYYLQHFVPWGIPVLGIDPAANIAAIANEKGIRTDCAYFGAKYAHDQQQKATLINATNVLAHVPNIHDFVQGFYNLLAPDGVVTVEFPSVLNLIKYNQLDTIYHEHYSYLSATIVCELLSSHGLYPWRIEELPTHGGSYRIYASKLTGRWIAEASVNIVLNIEYAAKLKELDTYDSFQDSASLVRHDAIGFLREKAADGERVVGYGAPAKCTTFCNFIGADTEWVEYVVDDSPAKQGCYVPGTNIPIVASDHLERHLEYKPPQAIVVFAWNLIEPISEKIMGMGYKGEIVTFIPHFTSFKL